MKIFYECTFFHNHNYQLEQDAGYDIFQAIYTSIVVFLRNLVILWCEEHLQYWKVFCYPTVVASPIIFAFFFDSVICHRISLLTHYSYGALSSRVWIKRDLWRVKEIATAPLCCFSVFVPHIYFVRQIRAVVLLSEVVIPLRLELLFAYVRRLILF